jgi:hypothetical protein
MPSYEFKVIPAPRRGEKARGVKTTEERYALALTTLMNELGRDGWDYVRADTLPVDERVGFTGTKTSYQHMLVFRRVIESVPVASELSAPRQRLVAVEEEPVLVPRLGPAGGTAGAAPAIGPAASNGVAAE